MPNFIASQSITITGLCEEINSTDVSDYLNNLDNYTEDLVDFRRFTFKDSNGNVIKQETFSNGTKTSSCPINMLTFNMTCTLEIKFISPINTIYSVGNTFLIACLLI